MMTEIYLTGAVSGWDDPFRWHDEIIEDNPEHNFINPYTLNDFDLGDADIYEYPEEVVEPAEIAIENSDGMLVRWEDNVFLVGSAMEIKHASDRDIPVVLWYGGEKEDLSPWLLDKTRGYFETRDKALKVLLGFVDTEFTFNL